MILHKLIAQHLRHRDDAEFYRLQACDAIQWIERAGVGSGAGRTALDLGCGHGIFGAELMARGWLVTFADETNFLQPGLGKVDFRPINLDHEEITVLGQFDLVICSNVLEHLARPFDFLGTAAGLLRRGGHFYLSWTNWLSPWGGHEFSPFHYLGPRRGPWLYDQCTGRTRVHTPYVNLFPTYIGRTLRFIRRETGLRIVRMAPRYYPELGFLMRLPGIREFLAWNCALLLQKG